MALLFVISLIINGVQVSKDIQRCQKEGFSAAGCSVYKKLNVDKK